MTSAPHDQTTPAPSLVQAQRDAGVSKAHDPAGQASHDSGVPASHALEMAPQGSDAMAPGSFAPDAEPSLTSTRPETQT
ncbi:MAG: hypothetical protein AAFO79_03290, partial [Pseudomonadota bacterium]